MQYLRPNSSLASPSRRDRPRCVSPRASVAPAGIPCFQPVIGEEEIAAATAVLRSGWLTTGPKAREFEQKFAAFMGGDVEAIAVNSRHGRKS